MIDQKTTHRNYSLPNPDNMLEEDVTRIKDSFEKIDLDVDDLNSSSIALSTQLTENTEKTLTAGYWYAISTGSGTAYEMELNPNLNNLNAGQLIHMQAHVANSGPATLNVNSLGSKIIKKNDGSDLKANDIPLNGLVTLIYDGTNFQITNPAFSSKEIEGIKSNLFRAFEEIQENHGGALLMEAGWSDSFSYPNEQGADEANSTGFQHDPINKLYKASSLATNSNSDKDYETESNYLQQEWNNTNQFTSQATLANGTTVTLSSGAWPTNCEHGRISFDNGTTWLEINSRVSDIELLVSNGPTNGDYNYIIRMSTFDSGEIKLNFSSTTVTYDQTEVPDTAISASVRTESCQLFTIPPDTLITHIGVYYTGVNSNNNISLKVLQRDDTNQLDVLFSESFTVSTSGLVYYELSTPYKTPSTPGNYFVGIAGVSSPFTYLKDNPYIGSSYIAGDVGIGDNIAGWSGSGYVAVMSYKYKETHTSTNEYISIIDTEIQKTDTSVWSEINSGSAIEALESQKAYYWIAFDPYASFGDGTKIKIFNTTGNAWRKIVQNNNGIWEYNNDSSNTASENWISSTTNDMLHAISQAISAQAANRMDGTNLSSITNNQWKQTGGWNSFVNSIARGVTLYSDLDGQNPSVSQYRLNYDSELGSMDLRSKTYDSGFEPSEAYLWARSEHSNLDGPGTFSVSRNNGAEWTTVPMAQQGLPLNGEIRILRGTVDLTGQTSGQDLRCRFQTEQGKDQFIHSWGLQVKS